MPPKHLQSSITLPRNFTFHYTDAHLPRTPEPLESRELGPPSSPRPDRVHPGQQPTNFGPHRQRPSCATSVSHDLPLPSIEGLNPGPSARVGQTEGQIAPAAAFRVPPRTQLRFATPPTRTPDLASAAPVHERMAHRRRHRTRADEGESDASASRPPSACSIFSDSSVSSSGTSASGPSFTGENVRSPDLDVSDQIELSAATTGKATMASSLLDRRTLGRTSKPPKWTDEMDRHLWATYLRYLQDPTMTPFRYDPGRPPPLGVCHRVARDARKTWRGSGPRNVQPPRRRRRGGLRSVHDETYAVSSIMETASSGAALHDGWSAGPPEAPKPIVPWPRSESATRRRLRELCQQRTGHTSHAQRQLKSRNPPLARNVRPRLASPFGRFVAPPSFSTRDMSLSLAISTSVSMRPDGPLARMTRGELDAIPSNDGWFGQPLDASASAALLPEPSGSILEPSGLGAGQNLTRLRSPFAAGGQPTASGLSSHQQQHQHYHHLHQRPATFSSRPYSNAVGGQRPTLRSPVRLTSTTLPLPGVIKRRAQRQFEDDDSVSSNESSDMRRNILDELIGSPVFQGGVGGRQRAIRNRGFSLGNTSAAERLANLFQPPDDGGGTPQPRHGQSSYYHPSSHHAGLQGASSPFDGSDSLTPTGPSQRQVPGRLGSPFRSITPRPTMAGVISGHQRTESVPEMSYGFIDESFHVDGRSTHWNNGCI